MGKEARDDAPQGKIRRSRILGQTVRYILRVAHLARAQEERRKAISAAILSDGTAVEPKLPSGVER